MAAILYRPLCVKRISGIHLLIFVKIALLAQGNEMIDMGQWSNGYLCR